MRMIRWLGLALVSTALACDDDPVVAPNPRKPASRARLSR